LRKRKQDVDQPTTSTRNNNAPTTPYPMTKQTPVHSVANAGMDKTLPFRSGNSTVPLTMSLVDIVSYITLTQFVALNRNTKIYLGLPSISWSL